jgi:hypothetical protein
MRHLSRNEKFLGTIIAIQGLALLALFGGLGAPRSAHADIQIPNPGERQMEMVEELRGVNARLDKVLALMQSGEFAVKVSNGAPAADAAKPDDATK